MDSDEKKAFSRQDAIDRLRQGAVPQHVGLIMDGNGRWAISRGKSRSDGHRAGVERLRSVLRFSADVGIKALTVYAFSKENWKRPRWEVETLMRLLIDFLDRELPDLNREGVQIRFIGDRDGISSRVLAAMDRARESTRQNERIVFNVAFNYGGRDEIVRATRHLMAAAAAGRIAPEQLDEAAFDAQLDTSALPAVDLVIRTSGEERLSNFLLWQCAYAEFVFVQEHWPDFDDDRYARALAQYQERNRRFGGV